MKSVEERREGEKGKEKVSTPQSSRASGSKATPRAFAQRPKSKSGPSSSKKPRTK